jgi:hypothetical protein
MRKIIFLTFFLFLSLNVFSFETTRGLALVASASAGNTRFDQVVQMYAQAKKPSRQDLKGLWNGREYMVKVPNKALLQHLYCSTYNLGVDDGPLFTEPLLFGCSNLAETWKNGLKENYSKVQLDLTSEEICYDNTPIYGSGYPDFAGTECFRILLKEGKKFILYTVTSPYQEGTERKIIRAGYFFEKEE